MKEKQKKVFVVYFLFVFQRHWISNTKLKQFGLNDKDYCNFKKFSKYKKELQIAYKKALDVYNMLKGSEKIEIKNDLGNCKNPRKKLTTSATFNREFDC
jgi:hypothetical protein